MPPMILHQFRGKASVALAGLAFASLCSPVLGAPDEFRAMWISRFGSPPEWVSTNMNTVKLNIDTIMTKLQQHRFNAVIFQMRGQADTLYPSPYEPWSPLVSTNGYTPAGWGDFDPMAYAINAAHAKGLEFHAYLNAHVCWGSSTPPNYAGSPTDRRHLYWEHCNVNDPAHRDWLLCDSSGTPVGHTSEYVWIAPGIPDFQAYWRKQIMYVVQYYDGSDPVTRPRIDGVHFDRIRTPGNAYSYDPISQSRRLGGGNPAGLDFHDWTRDQFTRVLCDLYAQINENHPHVKVSSAPFGMHSGARYPGTGYPTSDCGYGGYGYSCNHQDAQGWLAAGAQDFIVPQIYWADEPWRTTNPHFSQILPDWLTHNSGRHIHPGCNVSATADGLVHQVNVTRTMVDQYGNGNAPGTTIWSYSGFNNPNYWPYFSGTSGPYAETANVPVMPWKTNPTDAIILGTVTDGTSPIVDVHITRTGSTYTALSSADGIYSFLKVPPGTYTLTYAKTGVPGTTRQVTVAAGQVLRVPEVVLGGTSPILSNVTASNVTSTSATVTWTTNVAADSQVEYGTTTSYGSTTPLDAAQVTSHSVTLTGLAPKTLYHYRAISSTPGGTTYSSDYTFTTGGPPAISNVQVTNILGSGATITWSTDVPATSRVSYGLTSAYGSQSPLSSTLVTSHAVTLSGLEFDTTYHFQALSTNSYGSAASADGTFATTGSEILIDNTDPNCTRVGTWSTGSVVDVPKIGTNYLFKAGVVGGTSRVRWTPQIPSPGQYDVWVFYQLGTNRNPTAKFTVVHDGGSIQSVQNQYSATPNQGYWFKLNDAPLAFAAGTSGYVEVSDDSTSSAFVSADAARFIRVPGDTQPPTVPSDVQATANSTTTIQLTWSASTDNLAVTGYKVHRDGNLLTDTASLTATDQGLAPNTAYAYEVSAYDAVPNESAKSAPVSRATLSVPPSLATVTCDRSVSTWYGTPGFEFTAVGGFGAGRVSKYKYAWDQNATHTWSGSEADWVSGTLMQVAAGTGTWYLHLRGYNSDGVPNGSADFGPYSYDGTPPTTPLVTDSGITAWNLDALAASWTSADAESGIAAYEYQVRDGISVVRNWTSVGNAASVNLADVVMIPGRTYVVDVRATNTVGGVSPVGSSDGLLAFFYDADDNGKLDLVDFGAFRACAAGPGVTYPTGLAVDCWRFDADSDLDVDADDFGPFQRCFSGTAGINGACLE